MAKTYGTVTTFTAGSVLTAAQLNIAGTAVNNLVVPPSVQATRSAAQSIPSAGNTWISFTVKSYDTDGMFTPTDTKITIQTPGVYLVSAFVSYSSNATGLRLSVLEKNAASAGAGTRLAQSLANGIAADENGFSLVAVANLSAADTLHLVAYQSSGSPLNTGATGPYLSAQWIGRTS
jgi:uncharacterized membrane protein